MAYPQGAVERAMKVQEVIVRALAGTLTWPQAADTLGRSPRSIRRLRWRLDHFGYDGLFDRRRQREGVASQQQAARQRPSTPDSSGSGFFVTRTGHLMTNFHVVDGCGALRVKAMGGNLQTAQVVAVDSRNDLALLRVSGASPASTFRGGRSARHREGVVAIGYPLRGLLASEASVTDGIVSALAGIQNDTTYLQFTAPIQSGNSGGPLLDESGNVIGIVVAKLNAIAVARSTGDLPQNANFAISAAIVRAFLDANDITYESAPSRAARGPKGGDTGAASFNLRPGEIHLMPIGRKTRAA